MRPISSTLGPDRAIKRCDAQQDQHVGDARDRAFGRANATFGGSMHTVECTE